MRRPLVAGNWKMNLTRAASRALARALAVAGPSEGVDIAVFPPALWLLDVLAEVAGSHLRVGAQNCHSAAGGAYTGEISSNMLADAGASMVILGHSERRQLFGEQDAMVLEKARAVLAQGLTPVLCIGETLAERDAGRAFERIGNQLAEGILPLGAEALERSVIAYEPVWAIGTGRNATPEQAQEVHAFIREQLTQRFPAQAPRIRILYGGSVKAENAGALFQKPDVDGFLVGGASLNPESFLGIVAAVSRGDSKS